MTNLEDALDGIDVLAAEATDAIAARVPGVHPASEWFVRPDYYAPPREIRVGVDVEF